MRPRTRRLVACVLGFGALLFAPVVRGQGFESIPDFISEFFTASVPNDFPFPNPAGAATTFSTTGSIDLSGPFFQSLGTNGRTCATCHQPSDGMTVSAAHVQQRFESTRGLDPIFRPRWVDADRPSNVRFENRNRAAVDSNGS